VVEEEARLKREFKDKARITVDDQDESDEEFLRKKEDSDEEDLESMPEDIENLKPEKVLKVAKRKAKKELKMETDVDLLKRFYGDEKQLDSTDKFLRNYILLQCWKDKGNGNKSGLQEKIDKEDEDRDEEMDAFEQKYNFRFEEGTGAYLTTFQRQAPENTLRRKDDTRKDKRQEKKDRMEDEKRRK
jgi:protein KRI1